MKKTFYFLSGLPRSGSTVLSAILNQNPSVFVSTTSGLGNALDSLATTWHQDKLLIEKDKERKKLALLMKSLIESFYFEIEKSIIIDKSRSWPNPIVIQAMEQVLGYKPKIIATVRSVPDCMASFVRIAKPESLETFLTKSSLASHLKVSYVTLKNGFEYDKSCFCFVEYENLIKNPKEELEKIHKFLNLPDFNYDLNNIDGSCVKEDDENLHGISGLHDIKPVLKKQHNQDSREVLKHFYNDFCQQEFWSDKIEKKKTHDLDLQLKASLVGDFEKGWSLCKKLEIEEPYNHRAAFNRGWYLLRQGKVQEGFKLLDRGRIIEVFGNSKPSIPTEPWDGKRIGTVLLYLEGGLGDQIHQIRFIKNILDSGCKVIVACSGQLFPLVYKIEGVAAVVQHEAASGVAHDFYVQGMTAVLPLKMELKDISGKPYIKKPKLIRGKKFKIGLRWQGNPQFEHEQHRLFPSSFLFDAVSEFSWVDVVSLQRDVGSEHKPDWVRQLPLNNWVETQYAVASCDLVITSCTSVAHLSAAMGVETWIVVPILPYYLWAKPGSKTEWYDSVTLFRQEKYGDWVAPFAAINDQLKVKLGAKNADSKNWLLDSSGGWRSSAVLGLQTAER